VRTKTIVKNSIVQVDATPFKKFYAEHYDVELGKKKQKEVEAAAAATETKKSKHVLATLKKRQAARVIDQHVAEQFAAGRLLAVVGSRPGQSGRADGYILEGKELEFYIKKMEKKKK
jgi:small subunit ribosomal protein S8e